MSRRIDPFSRTVQSVDGAGKISTLATHLFESCAADGRASLPPYQPQYFSSKVSFMSWLPKTWSPYGFVEVSAPKKSRMPSW